MSDPWVKNRAKAIIFHYGEGFFANKKILDLGSGHGEFALLLANLGAKVTCLDARKQHLDAVRVQNSNIRIVKADLDIEWPFSNETFDLTLFLATANHLQEFDKNIQHACQVSHNLVLDVQVCDSENENDILFIKENKTNQKHSFNGIGCRPSTKYVEKLLNSMGMEHTRITDDRCNHKEFVYDWTGENSGSYINGLSRLWFTKHHLSGQLNQGPNLHITTPPTIPQRHAARVLGMQASQQPVPVGVPISYAPFNAPSVIVPGSKKFVIIIPSYKNEAWCEKNISSAINQNYDRFRVIFTDDCSPDNTFERVRRVVDASGRNSRVKLIKNEERRGALHNIYDMVHSCDDDEIILTLDGDDWFPHANVLTRLDQIYSSSDVWMTYGQYQNAPDGPDPNSVGIAQPYPEYIVASNSFRSYVWCASHLRTFYAWLFKEIKREDLYYNNKFLEMTWDLGFQFPMLEMSGPHSRFVSDVLYVYNMSNPINDHKVNKTLQQNLDRMLRTKPKYNRVEAPEFKKPKVGLLMIATGKYDRFTQGLVASADKHFLNNIADVTYFVFSDKKPDVNTLGRNIVHIPIEHKPWPHSTLDRFKHFANSADKFANEQYLYYADVDTLFVDNVTEEILNELVGVRHCGYYRDPGPFENNSKSELYTDKQYKYYYGGGFSGGRKDKYLELARWCGEMIDKDLANGIMPRFHDETALNRYFLDNQPSVTLNSRYHYPQSDIERYKKMWAPESFSPVLLLLDKDHKGIRS